MDNQLQELIDLQKEQNQLLTSHLWRFRFSLMTILLMMTLVCLGLGFLVYEKQTTVAPPAPTLNLSTLPQYQGTITVEPRTNQPTTSGTGVFQVYPQTQIVPSK